MTLSVVIPALNAQHCLGACIAALDGVDEIIVVDGGSTDGTREIAEAAGARLIASPRGRGVQLRAGAEAACGDWLLFLHADTQLQPGWRAAAERHMVSSPSKAASFRLQLDDAAKQARLIERGVALRVRLLALPYGDQGLLISRAHYDEVGGYRSLPLFEDVDLVRRIGRRRLATLAVVALTSAERWRRDGWFKRSALNALCLTLYLAGAPAKLIAQIYNRQRASGHPNRRTSPLMCNPTPFRTKSR